MIYSEASYFNGNHCQHCADRDEHKRLKALEPKRLPRLRRPLDVTDPDLFPNIAEAARYARERGMA